MLGQNYPVFEGNHGKLNMKQSQKHVLRVPQMWVKMFFLANQ